MSTVIPAAATYAGHHWFVVYYGKDDDGQWWEATPVIAWKVTDYGVGDEDVMLEPIAMEGGGCGWPSSNLEGLNWSVALVLAEDAKGAIARHKAATGIDLCGWSSECP